MTLKLYFMKCLERKISQCILPFRKRRFIFWVISTPTYRFYQHETIFVWYFWIVTNTFKIYFWDISETSENKHPFEISLRRLKDVTWKNIFFQMYLRRLRNVTKKTSFLRYIGDDVRRLKDVAKKISFLRCIWDVLKTSQKRRLFWDVSERYLRCLSQWRSVWDISKTSHAGWVIFIT